MMGAYILRRVFSTLPVIGFVALFVFSLLYFAPGDPASLIAGDQASNEDVERIRQILGLDQGFVVQFSDWLVNISQGNLGTSLPAQVFAAVTRDLENRPGIDRDHDVGAGSVPASPDDEMVLARSLTLGHRRGFDSAYEEPVRRPDLRRWER